MKADLRSTPGRVSWKNEAALVAAAFAVLALLPFVITDSYSRHILIMAFIYAVVASNWDLSLGYGGVFNFGHLALFGIGVYAYGLMTKLAGIDPWLALALSGAVSTIAAIVVTIPILRLKGIYIILVTFGFAQLVMQLILSQSDYTGGTQGMVRIQTLYLASHNMIRDGKFAYFYIALAILFASTVFLRLLVRSKTGASIVALRDNEEYAVSRGISLVRQRVITLAASAFFTGVAGAFYAAYQRNASVDVFGMSLATIILSMVLLGGTSTIYGAIGASFVLTIFAEIMADFGAWRPIITALLIIVVMLVYPSGLAGICTSARASWRRRQEI
ncbi:branched-chain amino acid ABC transporter permease [Mycoplana rhizolycopersici]|jgi:branched-chain amino acid transport system permease protein|uniref:Branched-chain amino acid ABC transporter permease n=1 Tax=Mycoplana rhizolycopersici TaxID=2746702 RepID=A0ABX2QI17_9HYPH|nr:branched-chain amino acid ABC transporter permease [Rhizobium rhizolycopersici]NVP57430.1 branched-chain amino acid ABC transporter permease [Rhizobium rhizolycopersici]